MIQDIVAQFNAIDLSSVLGVELEFYLEQVKNLQLIIHKCQRECSLFATITEEKGKNQFEVQTKPTSDIAELILEMNSIKNIIINSGGDFSAKPFLNQPGNALHIHINLLDQAGRNLFMDKEYLLYSISGLCAAMKSSMVVFAPQVECYQRFQYPDSNTPTTISWGYNNRTTALRVIENRIEHRVPCANSNIEAVIAEILIATYCGLKAKNNPMGSIYGIASDNNYNAKLLPMTLSEARRYKKN